MQVSVHSNIGKQRKTNQDYADYFKSEHGQYLFVLCDGVGGHQAGEVASELTTKFLGSRFTASDLILTDSNVEEWIHQAIHDVNQYIYEESLTKANLDGMGTTVIMAVLIGETIYIAHVGDSRAYAYHHDKLIQLTEDHSLVNELIRSGEITEEEGYTHPRRNVVTQSIGVTPDVSYEMTQISIHELEQLMLCSDGLSNMLSQEQMLAFFQEHHNAEDLGYMLIEAANNAGGSDNITVVLLSNLTESVESEGEQQ